MITLILHYPDGTQFIVGGFPDQASIDSWMAIAQKEPGWKRGTTTETVQPAPAMTV